ncbi:MAG: hypothetical protein PHE32_03195 [Candidatus Shapirobacteria bacterium]|nr:hypothetical protein [Candidatus Shapirobacteria bacterium]MDD4410678.1 hypothetical protein [Candidatus Shapirobacteria bacterium]
MWIYLPWILVAVFFILIGWWMVMFHLNKKRVKKLVWMILSFNGKDSETREIRELIKKCYLYPYKNEIVIFFLTLKEKAYDCEDIFRSNIFMAQYLLMKPVDNEVVI